MKKLYFILIPIVLLLGCPIVIDSDFYTPVYSATAGNTYYVSNGGNDSNDGLTESASWKTISKVNETILNPGDTVLFSSDSKFRGPLKPKSGNSSNWIKYGSYGTGDKPKILGSIDLLNSTDKWESESTNIWKSKIASVYGIGSIYMNSGEIIGSKKWALNELLLPGDFFFNNDDKKLYLFTSSDSPADFYDDIEVALTTHVVDFTNTSFVLFEGLHITMGSAHGFGGSNTANLIIKGCDFSYLGGGFLFERDGENIRYGNGIEFWGNAKNHIVDGNRFWEIYDTAVTNQNHTTTAVQKNISYTNNIISNCGLASFELWNRPWTSVMEDIYFTNNTSIDPGHGWGSDRTDNNSFHIASYGNVAQSDNFVIKNNIFYTSTIPENVDNHLFFYDEDINGNYSNYVIDNNMWNMPEPIWYVGDNGPITTFVGWQKINNQSSNGLYETPIFTDFENGDYSLSQGPSGIGVINF